MFSVQELIFSNWKITAWPIVSIYFKIHIYFSQGTPKEWSKGTDTWLIWIYINIRKNISENVLCDVLRSCVVKSDPGDIYLSAGKQQQTQQGVRCPHKPWQKVAKVDKRVKEKC